MSNLPIRRHALSIAMIAAAAAFGQWITWAPIQSIIVSSDGEEYLAAAQASPGHGFLVGVGRLPVYPILLSGIRALQPGAWMGNVRLVHIIAWLTVVGLVYVLSVRSAGRFAATLVSIVVALDTEPLFWERFVLTETVATLLLLASVALVAYTRRRPATVTWAAIGCLLGASTLLHGEFIAAPVALAAVIALVGDAANVRAPLIAGGIVIAAAYGLLAAYAGANYWLNGYAGLSQIAENDVFDKAAEYGLTNRPVAGNFGDLPQQLRGVAELGPFLSSHPQYSRDRADAYTRALVETYPAEFMSGVAGDFWTLLTNPDPGHPTPWPVYLCPNAGDRMFTGDAETVKTGLCRRVAVNEIRDHAQLEQYSEWINRVSVLSLPLCLLWTLISARRGAKGQMAVAAACGIALSTLLVSAFAVPNAFDRYRAPTYPLTLFVLACTVVGLLQAPPVTRFLAAHHLGTPPATEL